MSLHCLLAMDMDMDTKRHMAYIIQFRVGNGSTRMTYLPIVSPIFQSLYAYTTFLAHNYDDKLSNSYHNWIIIESPNGSRES